MAWCLVSNWRHAIALTNADPVHRRIYSTLGGDEFSLGSLGDVDAILTVQFSNSFYGLIYWLWEYLYLIVIIIKLETLIISLCEGLGHETEVCDACFAMPLRAFAWWCHQMETFSALLALCVGNSLATGEFHAQRQVMWSFDIYFDLRLNKWVRLMIWDAIAPIMTSL